MRPAYSHARAARMTIMVGEVRLVSSVSMDNMTVDAFAANASPAAIFTEFKVARVRTKATYHFAIVREHD